jgi:hypothetical protein
MEFQISLLRNILEENKTVRTYFVLRAGADVRYKKTAWEWMFFLVYTQNCV